MIRWMLMAVLGLASASAPAQLIYRCGDTYSQTPCPGGRILESSDPRTAAQRAQARKAAAKERELAAKMERERLVQEAKAAASQPAGFETAPQAAEPAESKPAKGAGKPKAKTRSKGDAATGQPDKKDPGVITLVPRPGKAASQ